MNSPTPFAGLRVVELASVLAGPAVGRFFAELGAEIVKIENPHTGGDITRQWKLPSEDPNQPISAYYASVNQNKQTLFLDLNSAEGQAKVMEQLTQADIVLVNFKPGDAEKFKMDYGTLSQQFPQLIYGHITGYGPDDLRTAFDLVLQAETGFMSMNGTPDSGPLKMPVALIDILAAHQLKEGLLVALLHRLKTGKGGYVHVSLFDAAVASLANQASNWLMAGHLPQTQGSLHPNIAPYGETFRCADGRFIVLAVGNDRQFDALCKVIELPQLSNDNRFVTNRNRIANRATLALLLQTHFAKQRSMDLLKKLHEQQVPSARVNTLEDVFELNSAQKLVHSTEINGIPTRAARTTVFSFSAG